MSMRVGEKRVGPRGRVFVMTSARVMGNRKSADKRAGKRFVALKVHPSAHRLVREFVHILNARELTLTDVATRSGIDRCVMHRWRIRSNPTIAMFEAALNAAGYELRIVRRKDEE